MIIWPFQRQIQRLQRSMGLSALIFPKFGGMTNALTLAQLVAVSTRNSAWNNAKTLPTAPQFPSVFRSVWCGSVHCQLRRRRGIWKAIVDTILPHVSEFLSTHFCSPLRFRNQVPTFAVRETDVSRHNGGTSGAPLKSLRDDSALRTLSSMRGLRGAPAGPHYAERRSLSDSKCWTQRWA